MKLPDYDHKIHIRKEPPIGSFSSDRLPWVVFQYTDKHVIRYRDMPSFDTALNYATYCLEHTGELI